MIQRGPPRPPARTGGVAPVGGGGGAGDRPDAGVARVECPVPVWDGGGAPRGAIHGATRNGRRIGRGGLGGVPILIHVGQVEGGSGGAKNGGDLGGDEGALRRGVLIARRGAGDG